MDIKGKINCIAFVIALIGLVVIGYGGITMLEAKIGELTSAEHEECSKFANELVKNHSEYLKFDQYPYETCKDGVLKRNFVEGVKTVVIGGLIICGGVLVKAFFIK